MKRCKNCKSVRLNDEWSDYCSDCSSHTSIINMQNTKYPTCPFCQNYIKEREDMFDISVVVEIECDKCWQTFDCRIQNNPTFSNNPIKKWWIKN